MSERPPESGGPETPATATPTRLATVAEDLCRQAAQLLAAPTYVVDADHRVLAASRSGWIGRRVGGHRRDSLLEVPIVIGGEHGWVIVGQSRKGTEMPPHLATAIIELLADQRALMGSLPQGAELKNKIIHDLLHGSDDEETLVRQARLLGMDLGPPRAVILIGAERFILTGPRQGDETDRDRATRRAQRVIDTVVSFFQLPDNMICAYVGDGEVAVLKASDTRNLLHWADSQDVSSSSWANLAALKRAGRALLKRLESDMGTRVSVGLGRYHRGPGGLTRSYDDARAALSLGRRLRHQDRVHCLDTLGVAAFVGVADERTKLELAMHLLSPLDDDPDLIETLDAFFARDCQISTTADQLGIHRNTLAYRLEKVALLTGLDPRRFDEAVQIRLALTLRSLAPLDTPGKRRATDLPA